MDHAERVHIHMSGQCTHAAASAELPSVQSRGVSGRVYQGGVYREGSTGQDTHLAPRATLGVPPPLTSQKVSKRSKLLFLRVPGRAKYDID